MKRILTITLSAVLLAAALLMLGVRSSNHGDSPAEVPAFTGTASLSATDPRPTDSLPPTQQTTQPAATQPVTTAPTAPPTTAPTEPTFLEPVFIPEEGSLLCRDYFVFDYESNTFLTYSCDPDAVLYPASITKLFTAYVALQYLEPDTVITAGDELALVAPDSSIAYIKRGHKLTASMLVEGMLLPSGNDAAYVLAAAAGRACGGADLTAGEAIVCFVERMNAHAQALGMTGTHFANPDGYHHEDHYTTPADMAIIARVALEDPQIRQYVGTSQDDVVYASGQINTWHNTNRLIDPESEYYCPDAIGLKTGSTGAAGYCLLAAFDTGSRTLLIGVFGCASYNDRFVDSLNLYQWTLDMLT